MKKLNKQSINIILSLLVAIMCFFSPLNLQYNNHSNASAKKQDTTLTAKNYDALQEAHYSIFINNPTYSFVYESNIYFIDSYDNNLKIFNAKTNEFYSNYLNLKNYGEIVDVTYFDGYIFAITKESSNFNLLKINLDLQNFSANLFSFESDVYEFNNLYTKLSVSKIGSNFYAIITPEYSEKVNFNYPLICRLDLDNNEIVNILEVQFDENIKTKLKTNLYKILLTVSNNSDDYLHLIFIRKNGIVSTNIPTSSIENENSITITDTNFERLLDSSNYDENIYKNIDISNANLYISNNDKYLLISYDATKQDNAIYSYTKIYKLDISLFGSGSIFNILATYEHTLTNYLQVCDNFLTYPSNQSITYIEISGFDSEITFLSNEISNPNLTVNYYTESNFIYAKTNKNCQILSNPWSAQGIIDLDKNTDIIIVGDGFIKSQNLAIEDYKYCLYTNKNKNYLGYISVQNYELKENIPIESLSSNLCRVVSKTALYSLPTKVLDDNIANIKTKIIATILDNSTVEILDLLGNYKSNDSIFIKVKVDNSQIGYIETNQIKNKIDMNHYIVCNASIKLDGAKIYKEASIESIFIIELSKGTRIKVIGPRDKTTGMTEITYQDEYGNVYTGFVNSDYVENDGWTTTQIICAILIAVNIGIMIVIFIFIRNRKRYASQKNEEFDLLEQQINSSLQEDISNNSNQKFE